MKTLAQTSKTHYDATGNKITDKESEHEFSYDEICIEEDAYSVLFSLGNISQYRVLLYLFKIADSGTGIINIGDAVFTEVGQLFGLSSRAFMSCVTKLTKLGFIIKADMIVHTYSGYTEPGPYRYILNMNLVMKQYEGRVKDIRLNHTTSTRPDGKIISDSTIVRIDD